MVYRFIPYIHIYLHIFCHKEYIPKLIYMYNTYLQIMYVICNIFDQNQSGGRECGSGSGSGRKREDEE